MAFGQSQLVFKYDFKDVKVGAAAGGDSLYSREAVAPLYPPLDPLLMLGLH